MQNNPSTATILGQSVANVRASGPNLERLIDALHDELLTTTTRSVIYAADWEFKGHEGEWIVPTWEFYFGVKDNHQKKKARGHITLGVQLCANRADDGPEWVWGSHAKVVAGYVAGSDECWEFDEANPDFHGRAEDGVAGDGLLWRDPADGGWFFAVSLDFLDDRERVKELVIAPLVRLLDGASQEEAFRGIEDKICYPPTVTAA